MKLSQRVALNTALLAAGRVALAASGLVGVAVATRYLGADRFGSLTLGLVFVSVLTLASDFGLYTIAGRELAKHPDRERHLLANVLAMGIVVAAASIALGLAVMLALYGGRLPVRDAILILGAQLLVAAPGGTAVALMTARQRAFPAMVAAVVSSLAFLAWLAVAVALDLGYLWIVAGYALGATVNATLPLAFAPEVLRAGLAYDRDLWRQLARWVVPQGLVLVLGVLYFRIDTFLLGELSSDREVALYGAAYRVIEVLSLLPAYFMATIFPELARAEPRSARLATLMDGALRGALVLAVPVVVLFVVLAPETIAVIGGAEFAEATPLLRILTAAVAFLFLNTVFFSALVALNRQGDLLVRALLALVVNVALNLVLIPRADALGAAWAVLATEALLLALSAWAFTKVGALPRPHRPLRVLLAGAAMAGVVLVVGLPDVPEEATLAVAGILGSLAYLGALRALGAMPPEVEGLLSGLRGRGRTTSATAGP